MRGHRRDPVRRRARARQPQSEPRLGDRRAWPRAVRSSRHAAIARTHGCTRAAPRLRCRSTPHPTDRARVDVSSYPVNAATTTSGLPATHHRVAFESLAPPSIPTTPRHRATVGLDARARVRAGFNPTRVGADAATERRRIAERRDAHHSGAPLARDRDVAKTDVVEPISTPRHPRAAIGFHNSRASRWCTRYPSTRPSAKTCWHRRAAPHARNHRATKPLRAVPPRDHRQAAASNERFQIACKARAPSSARRRRLRRSAPARLRRSTPLVDPGEHRLVPQDASSAASAPSGSRRGSRGTALGTPLRCSAVNVAHALRVDDAEVVAAVDDERRRLPVLHEVDRVVLRVALGRSPTACRRAPTRGTTAPRCRSRPCARRGCRRGRRGT